MKRYRASFKFRYDEKQNETHLFVFLDDDLVLERKRPGVVSRNEAQDLVVKFAASLGECGLGVTLNWE